MGLVYVYTDKAADDKAAIRSVRMRQRSNNQNQQTKRQKCLLFVDEA